MNWTSELELLNNSGEILKRNDKMYPGGNTVYQVKGSDSWLIFNRINSHYHGGTDGINFYNRVSGQSICFGKFYNDVLDDAGRNYVKEHIEEFISAVFKN